MRLFLPRCHYLSLLVVGLKLRIAMKNTQTPLKLLLNFRSNEVLRDFFSKAISGKFCLQKKFYPLYKMLTSTTYRMKDNFKFQMVSPGRGRGDKKAGDTSSPIDLTTTDGSDSITSKDSGQHLYLPSWQPVMR